MKCRTLGRVAWRGMALSWLAAWISYLPLPAWLSDAVNYGTLAVFTMSVMTLCVWAAWNIAAFAPALLDREAEPKVERHGRDGELVIGQRADGSYVRAYYSASGADAMMSLRRAYAAGTVSVNGRRYVGPPPWTTVTTQAVFEVRGGVRLIRETRITEQRMLPSGPRVSKSECDLCGTPMDVAWCSPSTPYFCHECRRQEIFRSPFG